MSVNRGDGSRFLAATILAVCGLGAYSALLWRGGKWSDLLTSMCIFVALALARIGHNKYDLFELSARRYVRADFGKVNHASMRKGVVLLGLGMAWVACVGFAVKSGMITDSVETVGLCLLPFPVFVVAGAYFVGRALL